MRTLRFGLKRLDDKATVSKKLKSKFGLIPIAVVPEEEEHPTPISELFHCVDILAFYEWGGDDTWFFNKNLDMLRVLNTGFYGPGCLIDKEHYYLESFFEDKITKYSRADDEGICSYEPSPVDWLGYSLAMNSTHIFLLLSASDTYYLVKLKREDLTEVARYNIDDLEPLFTYSDLCADEEHVYLLCQEGEPSHTVMVKFTVDGVFVSEHDYGVSWTWQVNIGSNRDYLFLYAPSLNEGGRLLHKISKTTMEIEATKTLSDSFFESNCMCANDDFIFMYGYAYTDESHTDWDCAIARYDMELKEDKVEITPDIWDVRSLALYEHDDNYIMEGGIYVLVGGWTAGDPENKNRLTLFYSLDDGDTWSYKVIETTYIGLSTQYQSIDFSGNSLHIAFQQRPELTQKIFHGVSRGCFPFKIRDVADIYYCAGLAIENSGIINAFYSKSSPYWVWYKDSNDDGDVFRTEQQVAPEDWAWFYTANDKRYNEVLVLTKNLDRLLLTSKYESISTYMGAAPGCGYDLDVSGDAATTNCVILVVFADENNDLYAFIGNGRNFHTMEPTFVREKSCVIGCGVGRNDPGKMWICVMDTDDWATTYIGTSTNGGRSWTWQNIGEMFWGSRMKMAGDYFFMFCDMVGESWEAGVYSNKWNGFKMISELEGEELLSYHNSITIKEAN